MHGPVPNREDQRVRRNIPEVPIEKVPVFGEVEVPQLDFPDPRIHPIAMDWYKSLAKSGQAQFYEPSDWQQARIVAYFLDDLLSASKPSSMMLATLQSMMASLLVTEGDRRRMRIEIERRKDKPTGEDAKVVKMSDIYRDRMNKQAGSPGDG
jgi:hypothetical protein